MVQLLKRSPLKVLFLLCIILLLGLIIWIVMTFKQTEATDGKKLISSMDSAWLYTNGKWIPFEKPGWGEVMLSSQIGARAHIETDSPFAILNSRGSGSNITVFVDGESVVTYTLPNDNEVHEIPLYNDKTGWHRIEVAASWSNEINGLYISQNAQVRTPEDHRKRLVVMGHSYAEGCCILDKGIKSFASLTGDLLGVESINEGIGRTDVNVGGNTSGLGHVQTVIDWKPDYVLAVYGYNARSPINRGAITHEEYQADYTELIKKITDALPDTHVFASGIVSLRGISDERLAPINQDIKNACSSFSNCTYIDLEGKWNDSNYDKYISSDGVHPSEDGYQFLAEEYARVISSVINK